MKCLHQKLHDQPALRELSRFLWKGAPYAWPLTTMLQAESTLRYHNQKLNPCTEHMGLGAAVHMSGVAEPAAVWLKKGYVLQMIVITYLFLSLDFNLTNVKYSRGIIELSISRAVHRNIIWAARDNKLTASAIAVDTLVPWCDSTYASVHVSKLSLSAMNIINQSIPRILLENPNSFPFLVPDKVTLPINAELLITASPDWLKRCDVNPT